MSIIHYHNHSYSCDKGETVLDALLKHDVDFPYSCKIGTCQSCLTKLVDGKISPEAQKGLKPTLVAKNYFLACQCHPDSDITMAFPEEDETTTSSKIVALSMLNENVLCLQLAIENPDAFKAGQYINLITPENLVRSYSIANIPHQYLELHIKLIPHGLMSRWLTQEAKIGLAVSIRGPMGDCFYHNPNLESFPIVLAGTGTGLAPLIGITRDALAKEHDGEITLIHGGVHQADLYQHEILKALEQTHHHFHYVPCLLSQDEIARQASIDQVLIETLSGIASDTHLFLCGPEEITKKMKMKAFLAGVPSRSIYSDAFIIKK